MLTLIERNRIEQNRERKKYDELVIQSDKYKLLNRIDVKKGNTYNEVKIIIQQKFKKKKLEQL